ncbi:hypothetical protein OIU76_022458 [Salix suchowensis]|nr:hypothetical protein OIU76_022458 [Salix suchowensis]
MAEAKKARVVRASIDGVLHITTLIHAKSFNVPIEFSWPHGGGIGSATSNGGNEGGGGSAIGGGSDRSGGEPSFGSGDGSGTSDNTIPGLVRLYLAHQ